MLAGVTITITSALLSVLQYVTDFLQLNAILIFKKTQREEIYSVMHLHLNATYAYVHMYVYVYYTGV